MFKRKQVLPAGPEIPNLEEIHQDIFEAAEDDVVFKLATNYGGKSSVYTSASAIPTGDEEHTNSSQQELSPGDAYNQVKRFVEANGNIKQSLSVIGDVCQQLENAGSTLNELITAVQMQVHVEETGQ